MANTTISGRRSTDIINIIFVIVNGIIIIVVVVVVVVISYIGAC